MDLNPDRIRSGRTPSRLHLALLTLLPFSFGTACLDEDPSNEQITVQQSSGDTDNTPPTINIMETASSGMLRYVLTAQDHESGLREIVWCSDTSSTVESATCHTPMRLALSASPPEWTTDLTRSQIHLAAQRPGPACQDCPTWLAFYAVNQAGLKSPLTWIEATSVNNSPDLPKTEATEPLPAPAAPTSSASSPTASITVRIPTSESNSTNKPIVILNQSYLLALEQSITIKASAPKGEMLHRLQYCFVTTSTQTCGPADWTEITAVAETLSAQALPPQMFNETRTYELRAQAATVDDVYSDITRAKVTIDASSPGLLLTGPFGEAVSARSSVAVLIAASDAVGISRINYCLWPNSEKYDWSIDHPYACIPDDARTLSSHLSSPPERSGGDDYSVVNESPDPSFEISLNLDIPQGKALSMGLCVQACDALGNCTSDCGGFYADTEPARCVVRTPSATFHRRWSGSAWERRPPFEDGYLFLDCDLKDGLYTGPLPANYVRTATPQNGDAKTSSPFLSSSLERSGGGDPSRLLYCVTPVAPGTTCTPTVEAERCYRAHDELSLTECAPRSSKKPVPFYRIPEEPFCHGSSCARLLSYEATDSDGIKAPVKSTAIVVDETPPKLVLSGDPRYTSNFIPGVRLPALMDDTGIARYRWCLKVESLQPGRQGVTLWQDGLPSAYCPSDLSRTPADTWRSSLEDAWGTQGYWKMGPIGYPLALSCPNAPCRALLEVEALDTAGNSFTSNVKDATGQIQRILLADNLSASGSKDTSTPEVRLAVFSANGIPSFSAGTLAFALDVLAFDHVSDVDRAIVYLERATAPQAGKCGSGDNRISLAEFPLQPADPSLCGATYGCHAGSGSFSHPWTSIYPVSSVSASTPYVPCAGQDVLYQGKGVAICVQNAPKCVMDKVSNLPPSLRQWIDILHLCDTSKVSTQPTAAATSPSPADPSGAWRILISVRDQGGNWSSPDAPLSGACPHVKEFTIQ